MKIFLCIIYVSAIFCVSSAAAGPEKELFDTARGFYGKGNYYACFTETLRYRYFYPGGSFYAESLLLSGEAYFSAGNPGLASEYFKNCADSFPGTEAGEKSLMRHAGTELLKGSPFTAYRAAQKYDYVYADGNLRGNSLFLQASSLAMMGDLESAENKVSEYLKAYPQGGNASDAEWLRNAVSAEAERPKKSLFLSVFGSIFIPGFGHFYAGETRTGFLSFLTNAALISGIVGSWLCGSYPSMFFFAVLETQFYSYSLFSAVNNVNEYNSMKKFREELRLGLEGKF